MNKKYQATQDNHKRKVFALYDKHGCFLIAFIGKKLQRLLDNLSKMGSFENCADSGEV